MKEAGTSDKEGRTMLPQQFLDRMKGMLGDEYDSFLAAYGQEPFQALRLNALKQRSEGRNAAELSGGAETMGHREGIKVPWAENCYYYEPSAQPGKHPYHQAGVYYIQEPSAMAPAELLEVQPGERVLDLCAAPGGKSTQIAARLRGEGFLLCNEINASRAKILSENVERMGIVNAYVTNETPERLAEVFPEYFDKILVDAPCSGEGMFRKNELACEEWSPENVDMCAKRQDGILDCAARMLRLGGRMVYSTCTFAPAENEGSVSRFLERWPEFETVPIEKEAFGTGNCSGSREYLEKGMHSGEPCPAAAASQSKGLADHDTARDMLCLEDTLRLWPHRIKGEGHFAALLEKPGAPEAGYRRYAANGLVTGVPEKELSEYRMFCQEVFGKKEIPFGQNRKMCYLRFGDNLYMVSDEMPSVKGLKVLRPGLHVGTLKKNRFEPSHGLALALSPDEVLRVWNLCYEENSHSNEEGACRKEGSFDKREVSAYLKGETFPAEGEKGWYLICVDGFGIGWGKLAGGLMKNHYPRGLRHG